MGSRNLLLPVASGTLYYQSRSTVVEPGGTGLEVANVAEA